MRHRIFLVLPALLGVDWLVSPTQTQGFTRFVALLFYAFFGFTSAYCLSRSLDGIPMSAAYGVWTGISVAGMALADYAVFPQIDLLRMVCIGLILAGAAGLRVSPVNRGPADAAPAVAPQTCAFGGVL